MGFNTLLVLSLYMQVIFSSVYIGVSLLAYAVDSTLVGSIFCDRLPWLIPKKKADHSSFFLIA